MRKEIVGLLSGSRRKLFWGNLLAALNSGRLILAAAIFSSLSFLAYGTGCFFSAYLEKEFRRYGLAKYRKSIGVLQVLGAIGLLAGLRLPYLGMAAAAGLSLMMFAAILVRIRIRDSFLRTIPAILYMAVNAYLVISGF